MPTRRAIILKFANQKSEDLIDGLADRQSTRRRNLAKIHIVCRALVERRKMIYPSAKEVAESGNTATFNFDSFPSRQTIYNDYAEMLMIWRKAFEDIENLEASPPTSREHLLAWDASDLDAGATQNVRQLQRLIRELEQQNKGLKELITDHIPVNFDHLGPNESNFLDDLAHWMATVHLDGLALQEFGLTVTPKSPPGTIVMDQVIWDGLKRMVDTHDFTKQSKRTLGEGDGLEPA
jgi:hypothetical protein